MKNLKFIFATAILAIALVFAACKKDDDKNDPNPSVAPSEEPSVAPQFPEVEGVEGSVTLVVKFDQGVCDGYSVKFAGDYKEAADAGGIWGDPSNTFEYARPMEAIAGWPNWYKIVLTPTDPDAEMIAGRPVLYKADDYGWGYDWAHSVNDEGGNPQLIVLQGNSEIFADSGYGEVNLNIASAYAVDGEVFVIECKKWNVVPCATAMDYHVTVKVPAFCGTDYDLELIGAFNGWSDEGTVALTKVSDGVYEANLNALPGVQFKFRGVGDWGIDVESIEATGTDAQTGEPTYGLGNFVTGDEAEIVADRSDAAVYVWKQCR